MVIRQAILLELSWLSAGLRGADEFAFASFENVAGRTLRQDCESGKLASDFAAVQMRKAFRKLQH
jgi:hypothetical protein